MRLQWPNNHGCCLKETNHYVQKEKLQIEVAEGHTFTRCILIHASSVDQDGKGGHRALQALGLGNLRALTACIPNQFRIAPLHLDIRDEFHC